MNVAQVTANTSLLTTSTIIGEIGSANPGEVITATLPNITALPTVVAATFTLAVGGVTIGTSVATNSGAGTSAIGPVVVTGQVPAGNAGGTVTLAGSAPSGSSVAAASATSPITIVKLP